MVLADTSVWIQHFRKGHTVLTELLNEGVVLSHPFVVGELACGNLPNRAAILNYLQALPLAPLAGHDEVLELVDQRKLAGSGIGWVDAHLLASSLLSNCFLWTLDDRLSRAADDAEVKSYRSP